MQLTVRLLGIEWLFIDLSDPMNAESDEHGYDCTTYPIGFSGPAAVPDMADLPSRE